MSGGRQAVHLIALLLLLLLVAPAQAQQEEEEDEKPAAGRARAVILVDENIEQWVFQQQGGGSAARKRLDLMLAMHVDEMDRSCKLTDAQKRKLQLSGRGDIKRFWDRYEGLKRKYAGMRQDDPKLNQLFQELQPLQMIVMGGFFQDDSLLFKSLRHTLTPEQFAQYDADVRERRAFRHRANIEAAVSTIEQVAPLRDDQRRAFIKLLTDSTKPARMSGQYEQYVVLCQMSRIPEEKLKPLFDEVQWKAVSRQLAQGRQLEQSLKQMGVLQDE